MSSWCRSTDYLLTQCLYFFTCKSVDWNDSRSCRFPSNMSKCYCWSELEGCHDSKKSDLVLEDLDVQGFRSSVHTNSQYFLAWMSPCMVTFAKRWVFQNQCVCSQHDFERNRVLPKLPSQISLSNWELTKEGNLNISRQRTFAQKKIAHFLTILPPSVSIGCAATDCFFSD